MSSGGLSWLSVWDETERETVTNWISGINWNPTNVCCLWNAEMFSHDCDTFNHGDLALQNIDYWHRISLLKLSKFTSNSIFPSSFPTGMFCIFASPVHVHHHHFDHREIYFKIFLMFNFQYRKSEKKLQPTKKNQFPKFSFFPFFFIICLFLFLGKIEKKVLNIV